MPDVANSKVVVSLDANERARALADVERRINEARATVYANDDGVVTKLMTDLEREWRTLSQLQNAAPESAR